jgi:hypothetical protein
MLAMALIAGLLLAFAALASGCNKYAVAYRVTYSVEMAKRRADKAIGETFLAKVKECQKAHTSDQVKFQRCVEDSKVYGAIVQWRRTARPAVTASIRATVAALEIAEKMKQDPGNWMVLLKPAACVLVQMLSDFKLILPESMKLVLSEVREVCK